ncbi:hypothetical protein, partial [Streptacidiphilus carbonis]|uniref:hypothetical protein n=1 Tax=Streptacidiphilus carbonis TaxID=105422 RepID=UPI001269AA86
MGVAMPQGFALEVLLERPIGIGWVRAVELIGDGHFAFSADRSRIAVVILAENQDEAFARTWADIADDQLLPVDAIVSLHPDEGGSVSLSFRLEDAVLERVGVLASESDRMLGEFLAQMIKDRIGQDLRDRETCIRRQIEGILEGCT